MQILPLQWQPITKTNLADLGVSTRTPRGWLRQKPKILDREGTAHATVRESAETGRQL